MINIKNIGIILRTFEANNKTYLGIREDLFKVFCDYNINIISIPISNNFDKIKNLIDLCDGVILSGGDKFLENDFLLIDYLYNKNIPTLGICLGMQSMARYFSYKNEIDVSNHQKNDKEGHYVNIKKNSLLMKIINQERIFVNSRHKSAIVDTDLNISAKSDDNIIEAVEDSTKKFFLGVQWHPETLMDNNSKKLFDYFVNIL